jgi:hypothetical protein
MMARAISRATVASTLAWDLVLSNPPAVVVKQGDQPLAGPSPLHRASGSQHPGERLDPGLDLALVGEGRRQVSRQCAAMLGPEWVELAERSSQQDLGIGMPSEQESYFRRTTQLSGPGSDVKWSV